MSWYHIFMLYFINVQQVISSKNVLPKFKWLKQQQSEDGLLLLNIKFPDGQEDDNAILRQVQSDENSCILEGFLRLENTVFVNMTGGCFMNNSFEITFKSKRLLDVSFKVSDGKVKPILLERIKHEIPSTSFSKKDAAPIKKISFPENGFVLRLKAFFDERFRKKFEEGSDYIIKIILEKAQKVFFLPSLGTKIHFELIGIIQITESIVASPKHLKSMAKKYTLENDADAFVFFADSQQDEDGIEGVAFDDGLCSNNLKRVAIVQWTKSITKTSNILAHEIGHLLGMKHDFIPVNGDNRLEREDRNEFKCSSIDGVMDYNSERLIWTKCSQQDFSSYFDDQTKNNQAFCLPFKENPTDYTKIAVGLGSNPNSMNDIEVIDLFSPKTRCQNLPNFPYKNYNSVGGLGPQEQPIICGGEYNKLSCLTLENGTWKTFRSLRTGRKRFAMTKSPFQNDGSKLFITGGKDSLKLESTEVLTEHGWEPSKALPVSVYAHCMVMVDPMSVMVIGGFQGGQNKNYLFNSSLEQWLEKPGLKQPRSGHSCAMISKDFQSHEKSIIVVGGSDLRSLKTLYKSTEILDQGSSLWRSGPELPQEIYGSVLIEDPRGRVILIGGSLKNYERLATLFRLQHAGPGARWEVLPQKLERPRDCHTAFFIPDKLTNCTIVKDP